MPDSPHYIDDTDALVTAALCGDYDVIVQLINADANVNVRDDLGRTALMVSLQSFHINKLIHHRYPQTFYKGKRCHH